MWPKNVGIKAIELYFPSRYVDQTDLEKYDGVSGGKYTIGLGQSKMGFCNDLEDIQSLCLTVTKRLLERYSIKPLDIGRLDVGTETIIDKSKSVKSVLMQLFEPSGATDIEGVDNTNACYGGTAALFNAINWVESSAWDGRLALVVAGDNAVYAKGSARSTGGVGAIAMIVGPDAPLVFDQGLRASYMNHAYDFYKPDLRSEYPFVDGELSIQCYLNALDNCYQKYCQKVDAKNPQQSFTLTNFDAMLFHSPYCKLVQKSFARLAFIDFLRLSKEQITKIHPELEKFHNAKLADTYFDKNVEKAFMNLSKEDFNIKTHPSLFVSNLVGNMYTPSVYAGLVSLLINKSPEQLLGKKIGIFSYGSGLASSMYSITIPKNAESQLKTLISHLSYVKPQLDARKYVSPEEYTKTLELREKNWHVVPFQPKSDIDDLYPGTYYLVGIDKMHRRNYERVPLTQ